MSFDDLLRFFADFEGLPIFPEGSLDASVTTTVWVGVLIISFFNLRLGWTYSGLVVPGYIVPLLIAKPAAAGVIIVEGVLTYVLAYTLSEHLSRTKIWCNFFGRDRFFIIVLLSIFVRLLGEEFILPAFGRWVLDLGFRFDYRSNLHSFGLIVVCLLANQLWKPGLKQGLSDFFVCLGATWFAIRWILIPLTNFNIGGLEFMYEDIAASFFASPKSYIVLLTAAFVASQMNLRYSWDFNGILVPSLLALMVFQPRKMISTFVEAWAILILAQIVLSSPWLRETSVENARKLALFFNVSFFYKLAVGWTLALAMPGAKITDFYGFGYLLPTLLAVRMHDKSITVRVSTVTALVTTASGLLAGALGFALTFVPAWGLTPVDTSSPEARLAIVESETRLIDRLRQDKIALYQKTTPESYDPPVTPELRRFRRAVAALDEYTEDGRPGALETGRALLAQLGFRIEILEGRYLYLREEEEEARARKRRTRGWGIYVFDLESTHRLIVEVPAPVDEWGAIESASYLFERLGGHALALAGAALDANRDGSADVLRHPESIFQTFHREIAGRQVIQVRGYTDEILPALGVPRERLASGELAEPASSLWIRGKLPTSLDLSLLRELIGDYEIRWEAPRFTNRQRLETRTGFAELFLDRDDRRELLSLALHGSAESRTELEDLHRTVDLAAWLRAQKDQIAGRGTALYQPPELEDLLYFDQEILRPILEIVDRHAGGDPGEEVEALLVEASNAASLFDYEVLWLADRASGDAAIALLESDTGEPRRSWGTYVFRLGEVPPYAIQVPRPVLERYSFEFGLSLFDQLEARALLLFGAHPQANPDGTADAIRSRNKLSLFNLVHQVLARESRDRPYLAVQIRGYSPPEGETGSADLLFDVAENPGASAQSYLVEGLRTTLLGNGLALQDVDGAPETAGYEASGLYQSRYLESAGKELAVLWLSSSARAMYRQEGESELEEAHVAALAIPTETVDLVTALGDLSIAPTDGREALRELLEHYLRTRDIVALTRALNRLPAGGLRRLVDPETGQSYLLATDGAGRVRMVLHLQANTRGPLSEMRPAKLTAEAVREYRAARTTWLIPGEG